MLISPASAWINLVELVWDCLDDKSILGRTWRGMGFGAEGFGYSATGIVASQLSVGMGIRVKYGFFGEYQECAFNSDHKN